MTVPFDFADASGESASAVDQLHGGRYWLDDRAFSRAFGEVLERPMADLLSIAMCVYAADRLTRRGRDWRRSFALRIPVSDAERWQGVAAQLAAALNLVSDDEWRFEFVPGRKWRGSESQPTLFPVQLGSDGAVGLFSGGLDSLAGAARWLAEGRAPLALVGAASSTVIGRDQWAVARGLRQHAGANVSYVRVPLRLKRSLSRESSQRTRSFLYLVLGAAAARAASAGRLLVFENGYGAYNPRLDEQQIGAQATLGTHPRFLSLITALLASADLGVPIELPHRVETKAEHLRALPAWAMTLISMTSSCDRYPLRESKTHCGTCGSCVLRRQSLLAARLESYDRQDYKADAFEDVGAVDEILVRMARQAWQFARLAGPGSFGEAAELWPSLALGDTGSWVERSEVLGLLLRYHEEWQGILATRPQLRAAIRWPLDAAIAA